jgi:hypothetical protein
MKKLISFRFLPVCLLFIIGCGSNKEASIDSDGMTDDSMRMDSVKTQVKEFIHIFPSHLKVALMFKNAGLKYDPGLLITSGNSSKLITNYDRALGLGFYGVDMAYSAINNQTQSAINLLKVSKNLSQELGLESVYESNKYVEKFEANLNKTFIPFYQL